MTPTHTVRRAETGSVENGGPKTLMFDVSHGLCLPSRESRRQPRVLSQSLRRFTGIGNVPAPGTFLARPEGASRMRHCGVANLAAGLPIPAIRALHRHIPQAPKSCELLLRTPVNDGAADTCGRRVQHEEPGDLSIGGTTTTFQSDRECSISTDREMSDANSCEAPSAWMPTGLCHA
jgi:hypothetical protein